MSKNALAPEEIRAISWFSPSPRRFRFAVAALKTHPHFLRLQSVLQQDCPIGEALPGHASSSQNKVSAPRSCGSLAQLCWSGKVVATCCPRLWYLLGTYVWHGIVPGTALVFRRLPRNLGWNGSRRIWNTVSFD